MSRKKYYKKKYKKKYKPKLTRAQKLTGDKASSWVQTASTVGGTALKALRMANEIRKIINVEKKYLDGTRIPADLGTTAVLSGPFNATSKGDSHDNREGDSMLLQTFEIQWNIVLNPSLTTDSVTLWVVLDKQPRGALPTYAEIFDDPSSGVAMRYIALRNRDNIDRFVILKKHRLDLNSSGKRSVSFNDFLQLGVHTKYDKDLNTGTVSDMTRNALYIIAISREGTNPSTFSYQTRLTFTDN